ncbi:MAG: bifunctional oligoribonuclease/PAP phosphatase NrnA [Saprospiraceae bacterium]|nr:bifunctional oligoribonuclease/PAP phosphatase NrnA [Saprospiraceae bacterium]
MDAINEVSNVLSNPKNILITSHRNPDGDAIGSSLAMALWLKRRGHRVMVAFPSEYPPIYNWMPAIEEVEIYDVDPEPIVSFIKHLEVSVILDYNSLSRIDKLGALFAEKDLYTILIDHHLFPDPIGDYVLSDTTASSTCELVYQFFKSLEPDRSIDHALAECLYTGILTDTGGFQYATSPALFRAVAELQEIGIETTQIHNLVFNSLEEKSLRLLGHCLSSRMEIIPEFKTGIIFLNKHDFTVFGIQRGDTEGIVNYLLKLRDVHMAIFIRQQPSIIKISFRSKGDFSVEEIAKTYFNGGGHRNAAGGYTKMGLADTLDLIKSILPKYKESLIKPILV